MQEEIMATLRSDRGDPALVTQTGQTGTFRHFINGYRDEQIYSQAALMLSAFAPAVTMAGEIKEILWKCWECGIDNFDLNAILQLRAENELITKDLAEIASLYREWFDKDMPDIDFDEDAE
jgi:hypothetical protein